MTHMYVYWFTNIFRSFSHLQGQSLTLAHNSPYAYNSMAFYASRTITFALLSFILISAVLYTSNGQEENAPTGWEDYFKLQSSSPNATTTLFIDERVWLNITIDSITLPGTFTITPRWVTGDFVIAAAPLEGVEGEASSYDEILSILITGQKITIGNLELIAENQAGESNVIWTETVNVNRVEAAAARYVRYLVLVALIVAIFLIGITTDIKVIYSLIRRPYGVIIGMFCQFIIMPFTAWSLAKIFGVDGPASLGLVLDGSCPGGSISNVLSVLLDVDYVLSITMTFFSTLFALAMMPLNLFIYGRSFVAAGETIRTPFLEIFIQLVSLVVPLSIGIFLGWWKAKLKDIADKYVKPVSGVIMLILICTDLPFNLFIFDSPWEYFVIAIIFPLVGGGAGFFISKVLRQTTQRSATVALETGVQNAVLAITVLYFFYEKPVSDLATRLPYLILVFTSLEGVALTIIYILLKKFYWGKCPYDDEKEEEKSDDKKEDEEKKQKEYEVKEIKVKERNGEIKTISGKVKAPSVVKYDVACEANFGDETLAEVNPAFEPSE